jgi:hypothetical protein
MAEFKKGDRVRRGDDLGTVGEQVRTVRGLCVWVNFDRYMFRSQHLPSELQRITDEQRGEQDGR